MTMKLCLNQIEVLISAYFYTAWFTVRLDFEVYRCSPLNAVLDIASVLGRNEILTSISTEFFYHFGVRQIQLHVHILPFWWFRYIWLHCNQLGIFLFNFVVISNPDAVCAQQMISIVKKWSWCRSEADAMWMFSCVSVRLSI